ncbi:MAG: tRNA-guanine transglycosylase, partial [Alphaproteobacteria bacterium]
MFSFSFKAVGKKRARIGEIKTPHGTIKTPAFIFCATKAAIKPLSVYDLNRYETQIILSNTYHLMLQPGADVVAKLGGLHKFVGWNKPMLTDSGGFQIFSLGHGFISDEIKGKRALNRPSMLKSISNDGVVFKS